MRVLLLAAALLVALLPTAVHAQHNVLLVILDDVGVRHVGTYDAHEDAPDTPTLDALAAEGVLFRNAWAHPLCSPTRAAITTGRHAFRTGIGTSIGWAATVELSARYDALADLAPASTALLGKWHLTHGGGPGDPWAKPIAHGYDLHAGSIYGVVEDYYAWERNVATAIGAAQGTSTTYATTQNVDDAIDFIARATEPWLCVLAFNAPHSPWQDPPPELHSMPLPMTTNPQRYRAMIQAADTELGRLLATSVDLGDTAVVVLGDNGTPGLVMQGVYPTGHNKGTVYEGGVNVPLIVAGGFVDRPGRESLHLVSDVDLFPTVLELLGARPPASDGVSFLPVLGDPYADPARSWIYTETFAPNGPGPWSAHDWAIRDSRYKLARIDDAEAFYDLAADPDELDDLSRSLTRAQQTVYESLLEAVQDLQASRR